MNRVKELRKKKRFSQEELAKEAGISRMTLCKIENDVEKDIKLSTLVSLAKALEVPLEDLFFMA